MPIDELVAKRYVTTHHYSGTYPAASKRYGLFTNSSRGDTARDVYDPRGELVGVAVFGIPVQTAVLTNTFPELVPFWESLG